jgi:hypothetical protein
VLLEEENVGTVVNALIEVSVLMEGEEAELYHHGGMAWLAGVAGAEYTLHAANLTAGRIEVAASVDQRDVLKDEAAHRQQAGVLIEAGSCYEWEGWRVDSATVRSFMFADPGKSVAAQATGNPSKTGVIGFAAWQEKPPPALRAGRGGMHVNAVSPLAMAAAGSPPVRSMNSDLGTGAGDYRDSRVRYVSFTRTGEPDIISLRYASREELTRRGIIRDLDPFPGYGRQELDDEGL